MVAFALAAAGHGTALRQARGEVRTHVHHHSVTSQSMPLETGAQLLTGTTIEAERISPCWHSPACPLSDDHHFLHPGFTLMHKDGTTPVALHTAATMDGGLHSTATCQILPHYLLLTPVLTHVLLCFTYRGSPVYPRG